MPWPNNARPTGWVVTADNWNEIVSALAVWGGNTDAAGYNLNNCPLITGGSGTTSTLTLQPTSGAGITNSDIIFKVGNNGAVEAMRVLNTGFVGIGTASPSQPLHVYTSAATSRGARIENVSTASGAFAQLEFKAGSNQFNFGAGSTSGAFFIYDVVAGGSAGFRIYVTSSGSVGIGTTSPAEKLDVSGNVVASNFKRGTGSPENAVVGSVGDIFLRTDGGSNTTLYVKQSGNGTNTGWAAK